MSNRRLFRRPHRTTRSDPGRCGPPTNFFFHRPMTASPSDRFRSSLIEAMRAEAPFGPARAVRDDSGLCGYLQTMDYTIVHLKAHTRAPTHDRLVLSRRSLYTRPTLTVHRPVAVARAATAHSGTNTCAERACGRGRMQSTRLGAGAPL